MTEAAILQVSLDWLGGLSPVLIYAAIGVGAALENLVPPVPADTFVLFGGFLAGRGLAHPLPAFLTVWVFNVGSALLVYGLARRHQTSIQDWPLMRWLLNPRQFGQVRRFYDRWGTPAIFLSRFLPALRAVVPVFAGLSDVTPWRMALPTALASGLWYGALVYVGWAAGENWGAIEHGLGRANAYLLGATLLLLGMLAVWWWRSRRGGDAP